MAVAYLVTLPLIVAAVSNLPPKPSIHLTPPKLDSRTVEERPEKPTRWQRNDSSKVSDDGPKPSENESKLEPHQQEARAVLWAAPAIPILSSHRGRSTENCNPCEQVPWVPMARALNTQQYALSIPTIQLTLPVNYGIPIAQLRPPPPQHDGPLPQPSDTSSQNVGPSPQNYKPSQYSPPPIRPPQQGAPPHQYGRPLDQGPQPTQYGPPPTAGDSRINTSPQGYDGPIGDEKPGLPPPPLPQRFVTPLKTYGPAQPQTQYASPSNINPSSQKYGPLSPPPIANYQLIPSIKYGQPFDTKPSLKPSIAYLPANPPPPHATRPIKHGPQQEETVKRPVLVHAPIPFPTMSKTQLPPLFNYQVFNDGKQDQLHSYLQPPRPQNVVFTITETEDSCKKCQEQTQLKDSEPAQAEHVTENVVKTTEKQRYNPLDNQKPSVQVVKSVPLAEYLASVEYPMQIIQAPILDVPDLTKYFDLGYHTFPQVPRENGNNYNIEDQNPSQSFIQQNQLSNHNMNSSSPFTSYSTTSTTGLDNVELSDEQAPTTNSLPQNHKQDLEGLGKNRDTTEKGFTSSPFSQTTLLHTTSTRPSQIFHITKYKPTSYTQPTSQTTAVASSSFGVSTTTGHYVTTKPVTDGKTDPHPQNTASPLSFDDPQHSFSHDYPITATAEGSDPIPSGPASLRYLDPPPLGSAGPNDWVRYPLGRGWGHNPPQPFVMPTPAPYRARFVNRPSPAPSKKAKHIHQIIVPYTTNKQPSPVVQEPTNNIAWTPLPPTNQGRKVPNNLNPAEQFHSTTGLDQVHQNILPTGNSHPTTNIPLSAAGSENVGSQQALQFHSGEPLNLPPHMINQILHLNQQRVPWPSGPDGLQQLLATNLQGLLRGEEDSVDFARLQKNIDNWTAEGYKQNSPSVNFVPVTTIPHIFNSKKIPDEYLTATEPTIPSNVSLPEVYVSYNHNADVEGAESQKHQVQVYPHSQAHTKNHEEPDLTKDTIEGLLNSWSLLDTKVTSSSEAPVITESSAEVDPTSEPTSKAWEKIQVSISPLTKEKVYVVTPVPVTEDLLSTRVERSFSVVTSGMEAKVQEPCASHKTE